MSDSKGKPSQPGKMDHSKGTTGGTRRETTERTTERTERETPPAKDDAPSTDRPGA